MTAEEAIKIIRNTEFYREKAKEHFIYGTKSDLYFALVEAIEALRRQGPVNPRIEQSYRVDYDTGNPYTYEVCGKCGKFIFSEYRFNYCPICGQRLNKNEQEESE